LRNDYAKEKRKKIQSKNIEKSGMKPDMKWKDCQVITRSDNPCKGTTECSEAVYAVRLSRRAGGLTLTV
jgi:hypothetical protein